MKTSRNHKTEKGISDGASTGLAARRGRFLVILRRRARWDLLILRLGHATFVSRLIAGPCVRESPVAAAPRLYTATEHSRAGVSAGVRVQSRSAEMLVALFTGRHVLSGGRV